MHLISIRNLRLDAGKYSDAIASINSWYATVKKSQWKNLEDVRRIYFDAEAVGSFTVFNIKGNKYRLIVGIDRENQTVYYKYFLTNSEYDKRCDPDEFYSSRERAPRRINGNMTLTFNKTAYSNLLSQYIPQVIETEEEYDRALAIAEKLTFATNRTPEEKALHKLLVTLIEVYETENYPMEESTPHEILQHLMDSSSIKQADLVGVIGSSGVVSEVVNGKRSISKAQAKALGDYFKVSSSLFI